MKAVGGVTSKYLASQLQITPFSRSDVIIENLLQDGLLPIINGVIA